MIRYILACLILPWLAACSSSNKPAEQGSVVADSTYQPLYARGFKIDYIKGQRLITVSDPFDSLRAPQTICVLSRLDEKPVTHADQTVCFENPRWITLSSTHISPASWLDIKGSIVGVAEPHYISDPLIQKNIEQGRIRNVGMAMAPDLEVVIAVKPTFVMVSPFPDINYSQIRNAGIAVVPNASYLENTPLARAEWLVFVAALFGKEPQAIQLFKDIAFRYNQLKNANTAIAHKPSLFTGNFYQGVWYASKGQNYMATYFADAGADYIYKNVEGTGTLNLEFEKNPSRCPPDRILVVDIEPSGRRDIRRGETNRFTVR
ncbi:MAG: ABC transporter substrate-binding protein [Breznakibacter sp.]